MFKVAVCDDDPEICTTLTNMLVDTQAGMAPPGIAVDTYTDGERLYDAMANGKEYDLLILDIELKTTTGILVGQQVRHALKKSQIHILFISGRKDYAMELFDIRPLNFLVKPLNSEKVRACLREAMQLTEANTPCLVLQQRRQSYRIPYKDIRYFECADKDVIVHTVKEDVTFRTQLSKILPAFPKNFIQIHKSFVVNMLFTKRVGAGQLLLDNGVMLNISQTYHRPVQYWLFTDSEAK